MRGCGSITREEGEGCTCKRRNVACHVPCAADYRLFPFNARNQVDLCRNRLLTHANSDAFKGILDFSSLKRRDSCEMLQNSYLRSVRLPSRFQSGALLLLLGLL